MASFSSPGVGSGLDVAGIVAQLVAAERAPTQTRLDQREAEAIAKLSALGTIKGAVGTFQSALEPLLELETFQGRTTSSENEEIFTATADAGAAPGRYGIEVVSLASGHKIRSDAFAAPDTVIGSGTLTITSGSETFTVDVAAPNDTLVEIAGAINDSEFNTTVLASIVNSVDGSHLVLTSAEQGAASAIRVVASGDPGLDALVYDTTGGVTNMTEVDAAADASLYIDGLEVAATSNVVSDAIEGVSISLVSAEPGTVYDLVVGFDSEGAREQVRGFVDGYNELLGVLGSQTTFDAESLVAAPLFGESSVRNLTFDLRNLVGGTASNTSSPFTALAEIGITTNLDGTLALDEGVLGEVLASSFDDVGRLFSGEGGFATLLDDLLGEFLEPESAISTREGGLEALIDDITDQREALDTRMLAVESRLTAQFSALDSLISQLDSTSAFLGQQLANLPGYTNGSSA